MQSDIELTEDEERAIRSLERLAKRWPSTLKLFGASGSLSVRKPNEKNGWGAQSQVATISGFICDGGDGGDEY